MHRDIRPFHLIMQRAASEVAEVIDDKGKNWTASLTCSDEQIKDESFEIVNKFKESYSAVW